MKNGEYAMIKNITILVAIFSLTLLMSSAFAGKPGNKGNNGKAGGQYSVAVYADIDEPTPNSPLYIPVDIDPDCIAYSEVGAAVVNFRLLDSCADLTTNLGVVITNNRVINFDIDNRSHEIVGAKFKGNDAYGIEGFLYISDELVNSESYVTTYPDGSFVVHLHADNVTLWRCPSFRVKKRTICDVNGGEFAIDDVLFIPIP